MGGKDGGLLTLSQGEKLVRLARKAALSYMSKGLAIAPEDTKGIFGQARGVFVTVESYPSHDLRGCIGYPLPESPLAQAVCENAINATCNDSRFERMGIKELDSVVFEISVLTVPLPLKYAQSKELPRLVKVGKDGLIVKKGWHSGLLLPQVPVEWGWNSEEFLSHTCEKAGMMPDAWKEQDMEWLSFQAQIFSEKSPKGKVVETKIADIKKGKTD